MVVVVVVVMMLMSLKVFDKVSARERSSEIVALYTIYRTEILRRKIKFETKKWGYYTTEVNKGTKANHLNPISLD